MIEFEIGTIPVLKAELDVDESAVSIETYIRGTNTPVALDSAVATKPVSAIGDWKWTVDFTTEPTSGVNQYTTYFVGATYGQRIKIEWNWIEEVPDFDGKVYIDTVNGVAGQQFPTGTLRQPSNNLADAKAIADRNSFLRFHIHGSLTLDRDMPGYQFEGDSVNTDDIALNGQNIAGCNFYDLSLSGAMVAATAVYCNSCYLNAVTNFNGVVENVAINNSISIRVGGVLNGNRIYGNSTTTSSPTFDFQNSNTSLMGVAGFEGLIDIRNMAVGSLLLLGGNVLTTIDASCVGGIILLSGNQGALVDNSGPGCIVLDYRDAGHADMTLTLADTNELQGDWVNGGRLDLIVDAINAKTTNLPADPASETNVNANETKIDLLQTDLTAVKAKTDNLPSGAGKGEALSNFAVVLFASTDHATPQTGLTVAGTISKDGGAFAVLTNSVTEKGNGIYEVDITATEMDADIIILRFTATGADDKIIVIKTA